MTAMAMEFSGVVQSFGVTKGYGFIQSDHLENDVFFGRAALPAELKDGGHAFQLKGRSVVFELDSPNPENGKLAARSVWLKVADGEQCVGTVKSYNPMKGFGFLGSSSLEGHDFFFAKRDVPQNLHASRLEGRIAVFTVSCAADDKLQAKSLIFDEAPAQIPMPIPVMGFPRMSFPPGMPMQRMTPQIPGNEPGQVMHGTVVSFNGSKGFGFIKCIHTNGDVYFRDLGGSHPVGSQVSFHLKITPDGKLQGVNVAANLDQGESYAGIVSSYSTKNGYGFVTVPGYPEDVYFKKELVPATLQECELRGKYAYVTVQLTRDGKAQASLIQLMDHPPPGYQPTAEQQGSVKRMAVPTLLADEASKKMRPSPLDGWGVESDTQAAGVVASYNPTKGFGFITSPSTSGDVFFGRSALPYELMHEHLQGQHVRFQLVSSSEGKPQAQNLHLLDDLQIAAQNFYGSTEATQ